MLGGLCRKHQQGSGTCQVAVRSHAEGEAAAAGSRLLASPASQQVSARHASIVCMFGYTGIRHQAPRSARYILLYSVM